MNFIDKTTELLEQATKIIDTKEYSMSTKDRLMEAAYGENPDDNARYYGVLIEEEKKSSGFELIFDNVTFGKETKTTKDSTIIFGKKEKKLLTTGKLTIMYASCNIFESTNEEVNKSVLELLLTIEKELLEQDKEQNKEIFLSL